MLAHTVHLSSAELRVPLAYLLLNPTKPTTIADELESFLHVLIYGGIRRVNSSLKSIKSIQEFLNDYFMTRFALALVTGGCERALFESSVAQTLSPTLYAVTTGLRQACE